MRPHLRRHGTVSSIDISLVVVVVVVAKLRRTVPKSSSLQASPEGRFFIVRRGYDSYERVGVRDL